MLKDKNQLVFEDKWPSMRPTILKLLRQEAVTRAEWHDLFWLVHSVCLWDDKVSSAGYRYTSHVFTASSGTTKSVRSTTGRHPGVHQAGAGEGLVTPGGAGAAQGLHSRVEEVLHSVQLPSNAIRSAGDSFTG